MHKADANASAGIMHPCPVIWLGSPLASYCGAGKKKARCLLLLRGAEGPTEVPES